MNTQESVHQNMKRWEAAKSGTEKTAILVAVREKVLHDVNRIINIATSDLAHRVEWYVVGELFGASGQRGKAFGSELHRFGEERR